MWGRPGGDFCRCLPPHAVAVLAVPDQTLEGSFHSPVCTGGAGASHVLVRALEGTL